MHRGDGAVHVVSVENTFFLPFELFPAPGERRDGRFPDLLLERFVPPSQTETGPVALWHKLRAYSCGYSAGFTPASLLAAD